MESCRDARRNGCGWRRGARTRPWYRRRKQAREQAPVAIATAASEAALECLSFQLSSCGAISNAARGLRTKGRRSSPSWPLSARMASGAGCGNGSVRMSAKGEALFAQSARNGHSNRQELSTQGHQEEFPTVERLLISGLCSNRDKPLFIFVPPLAPSIVFGCLVAVDNSAPGATFCQAVTTHLARPTAIDGDWNLKLRPNETEVFS